MSQHDCLLLLWSRNHNSVLLAIGDSLCIYYGDTNEGLGSELHMIKEEEGKEKQELTGPEPATSRCIADPLATEPWSLPATINPVSS